MLKIPIILEERARPVLSYSVVIVVPLNGECAETMPRAALPRIVSVKRALVVLLETVSMGRFMLVP
jgi:hypothetical protein